MIYTLTVNPAIDHTIYTSEKNALPLRQLLDIGGKGINVSKTLAALGCPSIAYGLQGGTTGQRIMEGLDALGVENHFLKIAEATRTNLKFIDAKGNLREQNERGPRVTIDEADQLKKMLAETLTSEDILVCSGSLCPTMAQGYYGQLIRMAKEKNAAVLLDSSKEALKQGLLALPQIIKPNLEEFCQLTGLNPQASLEELKAKAMLLTEQGILLVVISLGSQGALFVTQQASFYAPALPIPVRSTVGAGDAMSAALAYGYTKKMSLQDIIRLSMAMASGACLSDGTVPASLETVESLLQQVQFQRI